MMQGLHVLSAIDQITNATVAPIKNTNTEIPAMMKILVFI